MLQLYKLRNDDFIRRCRRMTLDAPAGKTQTMRQIVEKVINSEAPRYYVTFEHAYRMLRRWRKGAFAADYDPLKIALWKELADKSDALIKENPALCDYTALGRILAFDKASRFFISPNYAIRLMQKIIHENRRNRYNHLRHHSH